MTEDLLRAAPRCILGFAGRRGPLVSPMAFWSDGVSLWMTTSASSVKAERLGGTTDGEATIVEPGARERRCAVYVPGLEDGDEGLAIEGTARVFSVQDPVGLVTHWPTIAAAMAALAVKNAASLAGYAIDLPRTPLRWLPTNRVVVRVRMDRLQVVRPPAVTAGIAPALPGVVPPDVRRALAGRRHVAVATEGAGGIKVRPAAWGAGFALDFGPRVRVEPGVPAAVTVDADPRKRPSGVIGLALHGQIVEGPRLEAVRATWWNGFDVSGALIPSRPAGGIVLPD